MSQNILDEIEPSNNLHTAEIEQKVSSLLAKTKKSAIITTVVLLVFLSTAAVKLFKISVLSGLFSLIIPIGIILLVMGAISFINAYRYGEQKSILLTKIDKNRSFNRNFNRFVYSVLICVFMLVAWKVFMSYKPKEIVLAQFDGNEQMEVLASWWRPYRDFITLSFLGVVPLLGSFIILFLCLHTHEKTLSLGNLDSIYELKLKHLLGYLSLLVLTIVAIVIVENNYPLRRYYRSIARFFEFDRLGISTCVIGFFIVLFISHWFVYARKPQHL